MRDDEAAAEAAGVPTLRLKLIATTISGAMMAVAGAPCPISFPMWSRTRPSGWPMR
ncbi:hypothetical protein ACFQU7_32050 [Pseudoroseomonas wenyumeiae]